MIGRRRYRPKYQEVEVDMDAETIERLTQVPPGGMTQFDFNGEEFIVMRRDDFEHIANLAGIEMDPAP